MIYRSNLTAPDLAPLFRLKDPPLQIMGHDMPSDPDFDPNCGYLTHDEAAILYNIARAWPKRWVDIGGRFGWSTAHISEGSGQPVDAVDPEYGRPERYLRWKENTSDLVHLIRPHPFDSECYFAGCDGIDAAMIDGNHDSPEPTNDAIRAIKAGAQVLVWHDFQGKPIRDAVPMVLRLTGKLWKVRIYWTPNIMAVAWRADCGFTPPEHDRDPLIAWGGLERMVAADFDLRLAGMYRCDICAGIFEFGWSEEEAEAEAMRTFGVANASKSTSMVTACDGCYERIMGASKS